jgi:hypothetical protein
VELSAEIKGEHLEVAVRDTGCGIPHREQHRLFDKFVQIKSGAAVDTLAPASPDYPGRKTYQQHGSGLGLMVAQDMAQGMNTVIEVESPWAIDNATGSKFFFHLPWSELEVVELSPKPTRPAAEELFSPEAAGNTQWNGSALVPGFSSQRLSICIVEDDFMNRLLLKTKLNHIFASSIEEGCFTLHEFDSGEAILDHHRGRSTANDGWDVIVMVSNLKGVICLSHKLPPPPPPSCARATSKPVIVATAC